jgi:hypothetical protein
MSWKDRLIASDTLSERLSRTDNEISILENRTIEEKRKGLRPVVGYLLIVTSASIVTLVWWLCG